MMKFYKSVLCSFLLMSLCCLSVYAKDSAGITVQAGAVGGTQTLYSSSYVADSLVSFPYTKTVFYPDVHLGLSLPIHDINENTFWGINLGYDFMWDYTYNMFTSYEEESYTLSHTISLIPDVTFKTLRMRFFAGTGLAVDIEPYHYKSRKINSSRFYSDYTYTTVALFWVVDAGVKYELGEHLFAVADASFLVNFLTNYTDGSGRKSGGDVMRFLPKLGLMYAF